MKKSKGVYIIAEAGVNHNGKLDLALDLVRAAAETGANAVKFQTFKASKLASKTVKKALYQEIHTGANESQLEMLIKLELPELWHQELQSLAHALGIEFLSTAFDEESLLFLQQLHMPCYKVPSGELTNAPLLWRFAKTGKPLIVSTGMATLSEVEQALAVINHALQYSEEPRSIEEIWQHWSEDKAKEKLQQQVTLLHCTSQYPTPWSEVNLSAMDTLSHAFNLTVGYSDHTMGTVIPIAAVARGAQVIEKHLTLDRALPGPDHKASLEKEEFKRMVEDIRALERAFGNGIKFPQPSELTIRNNVRQSLIAARDVPEGKHLEQEDITTARTGKGLPPFFYWNMIGCKTRKAYVSGEVLEL